MLVTNVCEFMRQTQISFVSISISMGYSIPTSHYAGQCHPIVGDGISMGRPCCGVFACQENLQNNRHRFCKTHFGMHSICAIQDCNSNQGGPTSAMPGTRVLRRIGRLSSYG